MRKLLSPLLILPFILTLASCYEERALNPSDKEQFWYYLEDSDDETDHYLYTIYEKTGIPIFYTDKLGVYDGQTAPDGSPVYYQEDVNYHLTGSLGLCNYLTFTTDKKGVVTAADLLEQYVIPITEKIGKPLCIILCDTMGFHTPTENYISPYLETIEEFQDIYFHHTGEYYWESLGESSLITAARGKRALFVSRLAGLDDMDQFMTTQWISEIIATLYYNAMVNIQPRYFQVLRDEYVVNQNSTHGAFTGIGYFTYYYPLLENNPGLREYIIRPLFDDYYWKGLNFLYPVPPVVYVDLDMYETGIPSKAEIMSLLEGFNDFQYGQGEADRSLIAQYYLPSLRVDATHFLTAVIISELSGSDEWFHDRFDTSTYPVLFEKYECVKGLLDDFRLNYLN